MDSMDSMVYEHCISSAWTLLAESGECLPCSSRAASQLVLNTSEHKGKLCHDLSHVFMEASRELEKYEFDSNHEDAATIFSICVLMSQLGENEVPFTLKCTSSEEPLQASRLFETLKDTKILLLEFSENVHKITDRIDVVRKRTLAHLFGRAIFVSIFDGSYTCVFGKQLAGIMHKQTDLVSEQRGSGEMSLRLRDMWKESSQCGKYATLLRMRAQVLLLCKLMQLYANQHNITELDKFIKEGIAISTPTNAQDVFNRASFFDLRDKIRECLIAPCYEDSTALLMADMLQTVCVGESACAEFVTPMNCTLVQFASEVMNHSGWSNIATRFKPQSVVTSLGCAITVVGYSLLGNDNVHTLREHGVCVENWRNEAWGDGKLFREANSQMLAADPTVDPTADPTVDPTVNGTTESQTVTCERKSRWTAKRKMESMDICGTCQPFHLNRRFLEDPSVQRLRCIIRAYFLYAPDKHSKSSPESIVESEHNGSSDHFCKTYNSFLTDKNFAKELLCPQMRNPESRLPLFLQCASLMMLDRAVNHMSKRHAVSMNRVEMSLCILNLFNKGLYSKAKSSIIHTLVSMDERTNRWNAKLVASFTPMLILIMPNTVQTAILSTFKELRDDLHSGKISLTLDKSTSLTTTDVTTTQPFPSMHNIVHMFNKHANLHLDTATGIAEDTIVTPHEYKIPLKFSIRVQRQLWNSFPCSDRWVNVLHYRSCRGKSKRKRASSSSDSED